MGRHLALLGLVLALFLGVGSTSAEARIYRWVDSSGVPHFTDRPEEVPLEYRDQLEIEAAPEAPSGDTGRFMVVPGLNAQEEGEPVRPMADAEVEAQMREALALQMQQPQGAEMLNALRDQAMANLPWLIGVVLLVLGIGAAFGALILKLACRLVGEESPGFGKGMGIVVLQMLAGMAVSVLLVLFAPAAAVGAGAQAGQFGLSTAINTGILRGLHCETLGKSIAVTLMVMLVGIAIGIGFAVLAVCAGLGAGLTSAG